MVHEIVAELKQVSSRRCDLYVAEVKLLLKSSPLIANILCLCSRPTIVDQHCCLFVEIFLMFLIYRIHSKCTYFVDDT